MKLKYIPEIDGLRSVAVLSVIVYHAQFTLGDIYLLKGGFLGVDVFFVISGYIITSLILKEYTATGTFSVIDFYDRRIRRLLPGLLAVMLFSMPFAWKYLLPSQLIDFSNSLIASLFFGSNIYWYGSLQEYGAESALLKPFLHTWSLAVEEQFYIVYPLAFFTLLRFCKKYLMALFAFFIAASLVYAEYMTANAASFSFYMLPTRLWELLAGGVAAVVMFRRPHNDTRLRRDTAMSIIGALAIVFSVLFIGKEAPHPGFITLIPVVGTVLLIYYANDKCIVTRVLASKPATAVGLVSYSLYIWHYPIFAFSRVIFQHLTLFHKLGAILLTAVLSITSFYLIERPFRQKRFLSGKMVFASVIVVMLGVSSFSVYSITNDGLLSRFPALTQIYGKNSFDNQSLRKKSWSVLNGLAARHGLGPSDADWPSEYESDHLWYSSNDANTKVLIVGDSHSNDLFNAFYLNQKSFPHLEFARFGMDSLLYSEHIKKLQASVNYNDADAVIVSFRYYHENLKKLSAFLDRLITDGKRIILASNTVEFKKKGDEQIFDWYVKNVDADYSVQELKTLFYNERNLKRALINRNVRELAVDKGVEFIEKYDFICSDNEQTCDGVTFDGFKSFYDYGHWTLEGARYFGMRIAELGWLKFSEKSS